MYFSKFAAISCFYFSGKSVSVSNFTKKTDKWIFRKFLGNVGYDTKTNLRHLGDVAFNPFDPWFIFAFSGSVIANDFFRMSNTTQEITSAVYGSVASNLKALGFICLQYMNYIYRRGFSYRIHKIAGAHAPGMPGAFSPPPLVKRYRHASRHVRDARTVMHAGIANLPFPGIPGACATRNLTYLVRGPSSSYLDHDYGIMDPKTWIVDCAGYMVNDNSYMYQSVYELWIVIFIVWISSYQ